MNTEAVSIRNMKESDHSDLTALWERFPGTTMTGADSPSGFSEFLGRNGDYCFVAEAGSKLVGSVMAGNDSRRGYIYHLAVDQSLQGRGTGSELMQVCENALREAGIEKAHLFIYKDNTAIEFYEKAGWHRREDIAVMSKVLIGDAYMGTRKDD